MTNQLSNLLFGTHFKDFDKFFVGFDEQYNRMMKLQDELTKNVQSFPFFNIKKTSDTTYTIEMAVAGFAESQIDIEMDGGKLVIKGNVSDNDDTSNYIFKGISNKPFIRTFALDDKIEVKGAEMLNGFLTVFLEKLVPEDQKPRKIEIGKAKEKKPQLLVETK